MHLFRGISPKCVLTFETSEGNQLSYFQNLRLISIKHLKMTVWNSVLWKMSIQLAKIWPEMVRILKYLIVIWIESEYSLQVAKAQIPIKTRFTWCNFIVSKLSKHCSNTGLSAQTPYLSALDYWKIKFEYSSWMNLIGIWTQREG